MIPLVPLAIGFLLYCDGSIHPTLLAVQVSLWLAAVVLAYAKGGDAPPARGNAKPH